ncbi:MAG: glycoside hydrolase family 65 protein [Candidatus Dormibacteraeota bacterium]|nr:glycoside hydrolase family 65 protein [Candidatus Dormibacteraeota bacterium]
MELLAHVESVFALSNGHIGIRANLDEGDPHELHGTYLNGFFETRPLPYAESAYGNPEAGQTVVSVTDGKVIRLVVNDETFDVRYGTLNAHRRTLDLRAGTMTREADWMSPAGRRIKIRSTRFVSLVQRAILAIRYEVEVPDEPASVVLQSELVANEPSAVASHDPRAAAALEAPLVSLAHVHAEHRAVLVHQTKRSGLQVAAGMDHQIEGPEGTLTRIESEDDMARLSVATDLAPGQTLALTKFVAYGWSSRRTVQALRAQVEGALLSALHHGWDGVLQQQHRYLDNFWKHADMEIEGDAELQHAARFALFHVLQSAARNEGRAVPAKGLTGPGYDGHTFWDTETFVLPVLTYTAPSSVRDALRWRHRTLDRARERAAQLNLQGAAFPWRTIRGEECSGYWPAGTAAFHINADIADAVLRYCNATGDDNFMVHSGLAILVETARLWRSLGHHTEHGEFRIDGVTGPDEYSAISDNNVYTNLMAQRNLLGAARAAEKHLDLAAAMDVDSEEIASWRDAARAVKVPFDEVRGVHSQAEGFTDHQRWDFQDTPPEKYPLLLNFPYFDLYRKQVVKQSDLVLALHLCGDKFTPEQKLRDFDYYEALTVRDSSLSAATQAIVAAEVGHVELAFDYFGEAALMDLEDLEHNVRDGVHMASLAGAWMVPVAGFGGMRDHPAEGLSFCPRLPSRITKLRFRMRYRGRLLEVTLVHHSATYALLEGDALTILEREEELTLEPGSPVTRPIPDQPALPRPQQPKGREPMPRAALSS